MICLPSEFGVAAMRLASSSEVMEDGPGSHLLRGAVALRGHATVTGAALEML